MLNEPPLLETLKSRSAERIKVGVVGIGRGRTNNGRTQLLLFYPSLSGREIIMDLLRTSESRRQRASVGRYGENTTDTKKPRIKNNNVEDSGSLKAIFILN